MSGPAGGWQGRLFLPAARAVTGVSVFSPDEQVVRIGGFPQYGPAP